MSILIRLEILKMLFYTGGGKARQTICLLKKKGIIPVAICDGNEKLWGKKFEDVYTIMSYQHMKERFNNYCIVVTTSVNNAIRIIGDLKKWGEENPVYHCCNLFKIDSELLEFSKIEDNEKEYSKIYNLMCDDLSKTIFIECLNSKMTGNVLELRKYENGNTFFDSEILRKKTNQVYVDIGAYTGDTICSFLKWTGDNYTKIFAVDAERGNYEALEKFIKYGKIERAQLLNKALWSEKKKMRFYTFTDNSHINYDSPNLFREVNIQADNKTLIKCRQKKVEETVKLVETDTLDNILKNEFPTLLKVNALAADLPILQGGSDVIRRCRPDIVLEYGVRPSYLLEEIEYLDNMQVGYQFYLRQKDIFSDSKTILYAIGDE